MAAAREAWLRFSGMRRLPVIRQAAVTECGLACIAMIASFCGVGHDLVSLRRRFGVSLKGATLQTLMRVCEALGLMVRAVRCEIGELRRLRTPCVLHWGLDHFVVLKKVARRHVTLHDPARGRVRVSWAEADRKFSGVALEIAPAPEFRRTRRLRRLRLRDLLEFDRGFKGSFAAVALFALVSEALLLVSPLYLQTVIDQVLLRGDHRLLHTLALGFGVLALFQVAASAMRQLLSQFLSQTTVFSLSSRVMRHLLRLPVSYFRMRRLGDVQQRLTSLAKVQAFITESAPALLIDAVFLLFVSLLLFSFDAALAALVLLMSLLYAGWRLAIFPATFEQARKLVRAEAASQTHLLESLRAVQSIRLLAGEPQRTRDWQKRFARRCNAQIRLGNLAIADTSLHQLLFQGLHIGVVYLLAERVMAGSMTVGMVSAFVAYVGMFVARSAGVINRLFEYRLLNVPLERLADIVFHEREVGDARGGPLPRLQGAVRASGLSFCYAGEQAAVVSNLSLSVSSREFVAIRGPSGCGKSTLLHILAGIERPTSGTLSYDDRPASEWPAAAVRRQLGTVLQDDALVAGTIAENIALFDPNEDPGRVRRAARLAEIDADIERLPMGYDTRIGDQGSALSTGQVQRVLFARALYRRPRLLLLDEFTSGLDPDTERLVVASLGRLRLTRIVVTHSPVVMRAADRVIDLD
jgi:ATP-binding cassette subfamily B protein RaxB